MKRFLFAAFGAALWFCAPVQAQTISALTVATCGAQALTAGQPFPATMDLTGKLCDGAAGGFVDAIITAPSATYSYAVGAGGTAGTAGTSGFAGGLGGSGYIVVEEQYNY